MAHALSRITTHKFKAIVIGSGCAGLNAADCLCENGLPSEEIALITEGMKMGTSRNTGSDKQTYYKIALASDSTDGALQMANTYFSGKAMHGDIALTESANSLKCFFKLASLGVPFPQNEFGEFVGYKTDHDGNCKRATSAGPYTSKFMTEALDKSVVSKGVCIFDGVCVFKLFKDENGVCAALGYNGKKQEFELFFARSIVLATGGCAYLYRDRVYPGSQSGMNGMAYEIGAKSANLCEWQYGLASVEVPWNVSGTYQQVLPRYVSIDENGNEHEFLHDHFDDPMKAIELVFLKGYQWPFDSAKLSGSSLIDVLVHRQMLMGRRVYIDFMHNPTGLDFSRLSPEVYDYLKNSNALFGTPFERLCAMNMKAVSLYRDKGIDLETQMLRVAVCAQHQNGGIGVDSNYMSSVPGLYVAGEAAGVFGVYRPGGSALNSTQVSSMRAAMHIANCANSASVNRDEIFEKAAQTVCRLESSICSPKPMSALSLQDIYKKITSGMSEGASFIRDRQKMEDLLIFVNDSLESFNVLLSGIGKAQMLYALKTHDMLISARETLTSMLAWCDKIGFRGGAVCREKLDNTFMKNGENDTQNLIVVTQNGKASFEIPRKIPHSDTWFESVYNRNN